MVSFILYSPPYIRMGRKEVYVDGKEHIIEYWSRLLVLLLLGVCSSIL